MSSAITSGVTSSIPRSLQAARTRRSTLPRTNAGIRRSIAVASSLHSGSTATSTTSTTPVGSKAQIGSSPISPCPSASARALHPPQADPYSHRPQRPSSNGDRSADIASPAHSSASVDSRSDPTGVGR